MTQFIVAEVSKNWSMPGAEHTAGVLAIALMSLDRPGWEMASRELAKVFGGEEMYDSFRKSNEDRFHPDPMGPT